MNQKKLRDLLADAYDAGASRRVDRETYLLVALAEQSPISWPSTNPSTITCRVHGGVVPVENVCQRHGICRKCAHPAGILG